MELKSKKGDKPLILDTAYMDFQPEQWSAKEVGRKEGVLPNPLVLAPGEFVEGVLEFAISAAESTKISEMMNYSVINSLKTASYMLLIVERGWQKQLD